MPNGITYTEVDPQTLALDWREIWKIMGLGNNKPDEQVQPLVDEVFAELMAVAKPKFCFTIAPEVDFRYGKIIADAMAQGERYAVLVATAGQEVEDLLHHYRDTDLVKAFLADSIASEFAEATARKAIESIQTTMAEGEKISNSYSPGYCGWLLKEQTKLFEFFHGETCGVKLTESCLMLPIKSVSAVLAIGPEVVKAPYGCAICTKTDCYKKQVKKPL